MKNIFITLALLLTVSFAFANVSEVTTSKLNTEKIEFLNVSSSENNINSKLMLDDYCEITDPRGFYARGNCKKVLRHYRQWKALQQKQ